MRFLITQALQDVPDGHYTVGGARTPHVLVATGKRGDRHIMEHSGRMALPCNFERQIAVADKLAAMTLAELKDAAETFYFETGRCYVCGVMIQDRNNHDGISTACRAKGLGFQ